MVIRPSGLLQPPSPAAISRPSTCTDDTVSRVSSSTTTAARGAVAVKSSTATASMVFVSGMTRIDRSALSNDMASCSAVRG